MKLSIKELNVKDLNVGSNGTEFEVREPKGKYLGKLFVTNTKLIWCKGKTDKTNGKGLTWKKFIDMMEEK